MLRGLLEYAVGPLGPAAGTTWDTLRGLRNLLRDLLKHVMRTPINRYWLSQGVAEEQKLHDFRRGREGRGPCGDPFFLEPLCGPHLNGGWWRISSCVIHRDLEKSLECTILHKATRVSRNQKWSLTMFSFHHVKSHVSFETHRNDYEYAPLWKDMWNGGEGGRSSSGRYGIRHFRQILVFYRKQKAGFMSSENVLGWIQYNTFSLFCTYRTFQVPYFHEH